MACSMNREIQILQYFMPMLQFLRNVPAYLCETVRQKDYIQLKRIKHGLVQSSSIKIVLYR